jgi:hypothetical protein
VTCCFEDEVEAEEDEESKVDICKKSTNDLASSGV